MAAAPAVSARRRVHLVHALPFQPGDVRSAIERDFTGILARTPVSGAGEAVALLGVRLVGRLNLEREVAIGFGRIIEEDDGTVTLPLWWEASEQPWMFPTFDGGLELRDHPGGTELALVGGYQAPLGWFGAFADGLAGHRAARASLQTFLEEIAATVTARLTRPAD